MARSLGVVVSEGWRNLLALSLHQGELVLSLRTEGDKEMKPLEMASFRKLFR